jgi:hypothetical protein
MAQPPGDHAFVKTTGPQAAAAASIGAGMGRRKRAELLELLRPCFARVEPWLQAGKYAAALIAARQWMPRGHLGDPARRQIMKLPPDLVFRTKGQLAADLIGEVLADGIGLDFACGDEVYGSCTQLREFLEARGQAYVLRVPRTSTSPWPTG